MSVDLGVLMFWEICKEYISSIYFGERAFWSTAGPTYLKLVANLFFHIRFSRWGFNLLVFSPKQYLMQDFGVDCNLIFSDIDKFGYYKSNMQRPNVVELNCCITFFWEDMINVYFIFKLTHLHLMNYLSIQPLSAIL